MLKINKKTNKYKIGGKIMGEKGRQSINCTVTSCRYNERKQNACGLDGIQVAPCSHVNNGVSEDESMCSSYEKNG